MGVVKYKNTNLLMTLFKEKIWFAIYLEWKMFDLMCKHYIEIHFPFPFQVFIENDFRINNFGF